MPVKYFNVGNSPTKTRTASQFQKLNDRQNPIFNFDQTFIDNMQKISPIDIGKSIPFISLSAIDFQGKVIENFNVKYFHKMFDMTTVGQSRFSDRPLMSIKSVEIQSTQMSGYFYILDVKINLKLHKPDALTSSGLIALLFPGMPLLLEYGWSSGADTFLNQRESLIVSVKSYTINMDQSGQSELSIEGTAFNDRFNNTLIGDEAKEVTTDRISNDEFDGLAKNKKTLEAAMQVISGIKGTNDYSLKKQLAESFRDLEDKSRGTIRDNFKKKLKELKDLVSTVKFGPDSIQAISFHDLIHHLLVPTLNAMEGSLFPNVENYRLIYGAFNSKFSAFGDQCIADFPIDWKRLNSVINSEVESGQTVLSVQTFLEMLIRNFIENDTYWRTKERSQEENYAPDVVVKFSSRFYNNQTFVEIFIFDSTTGLPITTATIPEGKASIESVEKTFKDNGIPILKLGHVNSYIKNVSLSQITDGNIKAVLLKRMDENRTITGRKPVPPDKARATIKDTPLVLPLKGTMELLGHIEWRPLRAFYLSTGNFIIDGVYKIINVKHDISAEGFRTSIDFMHH